MYTPLSSSCVMPSFFSFLTTNCGEHPIIFDISSAVFSSAWCRWYNHCGSFRRGSNKCFRSFSVIILVSVLCFGRGSLLGILLFVLLCLLFRLLLVSIFCGGLRVL